MSRATKPRHGMCRRDFLVRSSATLAATYAASLAGAAHKLAATASAATVTGAPSRPCRVRAAFLRIPGKYWMGWPGAAYDVEGHTREFSGKLAQMASDLNIELVIDTSPLTNPDAAARFANEIKANPPDGVVLIPQHMEMWGLVDKIADGAVPAIVFSHMGTSFTGHIAGLSKRKGVYVVSTLDIEPVRYGLRMIRTIGQLKNDRVLVLTGEKAEDRTFDPLGMTLHILPRQRFADEFKAIGLLAEARQIARACMRDARKIVEPSEDDVVASAQAYLTAKRLLEAESCSAITLDCLGLIGSRIIATTPCLAWSKLNDEGTAAACEADIDAVMTLLLLQRLFDKPGFMEDPVSDTIRNTYIGAHCSSPTKLAGVGGPSEPFILRSHQESNKSVAMQVLWKPGQRITLTKFAGPKKVLVGTGAVITNIDTPPSGGCRTSVEVNVDDVADSIAVKGFHVVLIYGDEHARQVQSFCQLAKIESEHI